MGQSAAMKFVFFSELSDGQPLAALRQYNMCRYTVLGVIACFCPVSSVCFSSSPFAVLRGCCSSLCSLRFAPCGLSAFCGSYGCPRPAPISQARRVRSFPPTPASYGLTRQQIINTPPTHPTQAADAASVLNIKCLQNNTFMNI